jgi:excisionase family DNA binding protein
VSDPNEIIRTAEAARLLDVSPRTLQEWAREGKVPFVSLPSGRLRFRRSDVEALRTPVTTPAQPVPATEEAAS